MAAAAAATAGKRILFCHFHKAVHREWNKKQGNAMEMLLWKCGERRAFSRFKVSLVSFCSVRRLAVSREEGEQFFGG